MNSDLFWFILSLIGGILVSLFFYLLGIKRKHLAYYINTITLISDNLDIIKGLDIKYNNHTITNLNYSEIYFKNMGNCSIENSDFLSSSPIHLFTDGEFLLNDINKILLRRVNKESQNMDFKLTFSITNKKYNKISFKFDHIPKKSYFKFSVFHTGNIDLKGKLKDGKITQIYDESQFL